MEKSSKISEAVGTHKVPIAIPVLPGDPYSICKKEVKQAIRTDEGMDPVFDSEALQDFTEFLNSTHLSVEAKNSTGSVDGDSPQAYATSALVLNC